MGPQSAASLFESGIVDILDHYSTLKKHQGQCDKPDSIQCSDQFIHVLLARLNADRQLLSLDSSTSSKHRLPNMWLALAGRKLLTCFGELTTNFHSIFTCLVHQSIILAMVVNSMFRFASHNSLVDVFPLFAL